MIRRREFITLFCGAVAAAAAWPLAARAQQGNRVRRIGVLTGGVESDPSVKSGVSAFTQALRDLGWNDGRNVRMDLRWGGGDINRVRRRWGRATARAYSMTSSARSIIDGGTVSPRAVAVLRFTIISNLVGSCTGRSPGFSPRRMRST